MVQIFLSELRIFSHYQEDDQAARDTCNEPRPRPPLIATLPLPAISETISRRLGIIGGDARDG